MARDVGAVQIQARGTLGGNLATGSPAADGVPVLAALACEIDVASAARGVRTVPIAGFFTGYRRTVMAPDEMITAVRFEAPGDVWTWRKVGTRMAQSIAKVALAACARVASGRIEQAHFGMASVAPTTALLRGVQSYLIGRDVKSVHDDELVSALRKDIAPIDDVRSTAAYRLHVAERLVAQFAAQLRAR
jgi:CO/xanthine dehydrogenase FAD-binding subunit